MKTGILSSKFSERFNFVVLLSEGGASNVQLHPWKIGALGLSVTGEYQWSLVWTLRHWPLWKLGGNLRPTKKHGEKNASSDWERQKIVAKYLYRTTVLEECHHQASLNIIMKHQHKTSSNINIDIIHWLHLSILDWPLAAKSSVMQGVARELFRLFVEVVRVKMENDAVFSNRTAWFCCRLWSMYIDILHTHSIYIYMYVCLYMYI